MPWRPMELRGSRVLARCDEAGALAVDSGRVEIRYRPTDGRAYHAAARNLKPIAGASVLPDAHCEQAAPAPRPPKPVRAKEDGQLPTRPAGDELLSYADGACSGNPGPAGIGVVVLWGDERLELSEYLGHGTNNIAELTAVLRVAEIAAERHRERPVRLYTDSSYAIGVLTKGWKAKANQELVAQVKRALSKVPDVELIHVRGHAGVTLNERADALARLAVETRSSTGWLPA